MAQNNISLARARGNFMTWCISGYMPLAGLCRPLYVGQKLTSATASVPGEFYVIYSMNEARELFGAGSVLATMAIQHFCSCEELPLYVAPVDDPVGDAAVHHLHINGTASNNGVLSVAILDELYQVGVLVNTTMESMAASLAAQMQKNIDLPFHVSVAGNTINFTAKNAGTVGNWFAPQWNPNFGDEFPRDVTVTQSQTVIGAGILDIDPAIPVFACAWDCIALGTEEEAAVNTVVQLVRWNWRCGVQGDFKGGHMFHSKTDTAGQIAAYGRDRNNPEETVVPVRTGYKYPGYVMTAAFTSRVCCTACTEPARPVQYDNGLLGCLYDSAMCSSVWSSSEKKAFYDAGIANWDVANSRGTRQTALVIEEPLTTYKYDPNTGAPDGAWQRVESRYTTAKFIRDLGNWYRHNYSSVSLMSNGTRIPPGVRAITPRILQASIIAWLRGTQLGFTAEATSGQLEEMVQVERTNTPNFCDPNRVNVMIDLDLVNQLARIATTVDVSPEFACTAPVLLPT